MITQYKEKEDQKSEMTPLPAERWAWQPAPRGLQRKPFRDVMQWSTGSEVRGGQEHRVHMPALGF